MKAFKDTIFTLKLSDDKTTFSVDETARRAKFTQTAGSINEFILSGHVER